MKTCFGLCDAWNERRLFGSPREQPNGNREISTEISLEKAMLLIVQIHPLSGRRPPARTTISKKSSYHRYQHLCTNNPCRSISLMFVCANNRQDVGARRWLAFPVEFHVRTAFLGIVDIFDHTDVPFGSEAVLMHREETKRHKVHRGVSYEGVTQNRGHILWRDRTLAYLHT